MAVKDGLRNLVSKFKKEQTLSTEAVERAKKVIAAAKEAANRKKK